MTFQLYVNHSPCGSGSLPDLLQAVVVTPAEVVGELLVDVVQVGRAVFVDVEGELVLVVL